MNSPRSKLRGITSATLCYADNIEQKGWCSFILLIQQLIHPFQAQLQKLPSMGSAGLRITTGHIIDQSDSPIEILFLKYPLARVRSIRLGIKKPERQFVILDRKALAAVEGPGGGEVTTGSGS